MLFTSEVFLFLFLPITLFVFFLLGARGWRRMAIAWLVAASAFFYGWFRSDYLLLLAILILFNYAWGIKLSRDHRSGRPRKINLAFGLAVNLGVLGYFKYTNFLIENANALFHSSFALEKIILPIGISFFIFQKIAYLVDAYRGEAKEYNFLDFSLFVMYFPQLIAGPIVHHKELIPQFRNASIFKVSYTDLAAGLTLFTIGLVKKIAIADRIMLWSDQVFATANTGSPTFFEAWGGALAFAFQIYFDFSAYSDMALGLAMMIGIRLPMNFNSPYKATSIIDFWRCWHMTLSRFLRDYVYFALGGNRRGRARRYINLMATMLLGGLWHGAAWTFVVWGGLHGAYLMINHGWRSWKARRRARADVATSPHAIWGARLLTFVAVVVAWVFFRAESFGAALRVLEGMAGLRGFGIPAAFMVYLGDYQSWVATLGIGFDSATGAVIPGVRRAIVLFLLLALVWLAPNSQELVGHFRPALEPMRVAKLPNLLRGLGVGLQLTERDGSLALGPVTGVLVAALLCSVAVYQTMQSTVLQKFIYFQF
jgi:D-alanyl-lipoteichoic acid acyltransferase DltB (MBOAT superfamily)